jgi:putative FmdB family regulatory protein
VPIYEYECEKCGHKFEAIQKFSDKPVKKCVLCQGPVHRLLGSPALVFKGTGWYVTDYASRDRKTAMDKEKAEKSGTAETKSESKSESKAEPKAESKADSRKS